MQTSDFLFSLLRAIYNHALWCYKSVIADAADDFHPDDSHRSIISVIRGLVPIVLSY